MPRKRHEFPRVVLTDAAGSVGRRVTVLEQSCGVEQREPSSVAAVRSLTITVCYGSLK